MFPARAVPARRVFVFIVAVGLLTGLGWLFGFAWRATAVASRAAVGTLPPPPAPVASAERLLRELAKDLSATLGESRHVLVGTRDPSVRSCSEQSLQGSTLLLPGDPAGGPGLRIMALYHCPLASPAEAFVWSQGELRQALEAMRRQNASVLPKAAALLHKAEELVRTLSDRRRMPRALPALDPVDDGTWCGHCFGEILKAIPGKDAAAARNWAAELNAALFALTDLHRWLDLLLDNHLASLDFQTRCRALYDYAQQTYHSGVPVSESGLSAFFLIVSRGRSYLEVERQAERLFQVAPRITREAGSGFSDVRAAVWMPPDLRRAYVAVRSALSPKAQRVLDQAASSPFERSYLSGVLFRAAAENGLDDLCLVLRRFERAHAEPTVPDMMDTLFHRAGFYSSGFRWDDRYDSRLMDPAGRMSHNAAEALRQSHRAVHQFMGDWGNYGGQVMTLTDALDRRKLDCVRGTDMIGGLFRNAGQSGYCIVRLCGGQSGHSVGAVAIDGQGARRIRLVDSLLPATTEAYWPSAYFGELQWPEGYPGPRNQPFSAELCVRGLDGYLFAEGYVVRGPHAGELVRAALPYLPDRATADVMKAYYGPYPALPPPLAAQATP